MNYENTYHANNCALAIIALLLPAPGSSPPGEAYGTVIEVIDRYTIEVQLASHNGRIVLCKICIPP